MIRFQPDFFAFSAEPIADVIVRELSDLLSPKKRFRAGNTLCFEGVTTDAVRRIKAQASAERNRLDSLFWARNTSITQYKAFFFDMDSTLVTTETLDEMAELCGTGKACAEITAAAMAGTIKNYAESLRARVALLKGMDASVLDTVKANTRINPGARELIAALNANGIKSYVLSSGFTVCTSVIARELGMTGYHSNVIGIENGRFTGSVTGPEGGVIVDGAGKLAFAERTVKALGGTMENAACAGDGSNDRLMVSAAGLGIGFRPKAVLKPYCTVSLMTTGFASLLALFKETTPTMTEF